LYDQLAAEVGQNATLIKVDTSQVFDVGQKYDVRATPTFATFLHGKEQERWSGADAARLRGTVGLLVEMAHPKHPHELLRLPHFANPNIKPVLYTKIPPLEKLLAKLGPQATNNLSVQRVKHFIETRTKEGSAQVSTPDFP
jgi:desumoylating isopeptidase 1